MGVGDLTMAAGAAVSLLIAISGLYAAYSVNRDYRSAQSALSEAQLAKARALVGEVAPSAGEPVPFETEQLAQYYATVLSQSRTSFWFSLGFAALGFLVIIVAVFLYDDPTSGPAYVQFAAGLVIDAVASLFFVQSKNAQKSMGEFFDKLRRDRQQLAVRRLCDEVEDPRLQDRLRVQLALYYAGIPDSDRVAGYVLASQEPEGPGGA